jgi:Cu(I)/Ag(I) efflux system membrane fusion protein
VKAYLPIADALASDDFEKARHAAATLARVAKASGNTAVYQPTLGVVHAPDIAAAREAFKQLSAVVAPLAANNGDFVVMNCPMAKADWVQTDAKVRNPYFGSAMLTCGVPKK